MSSISIIAESSGKTFEPIAAGSYVARCYSIVLLGTFEEDFQGTKKVVQKVKITFELPTEMKVFDEAKGEQPQIISIDFTLSMAEKANLRAFLTNWRGKAYTEEEAKKVDISKMVGVPCQLSIIHRTSKSNGRTYATIASASMLMKGFEAPKQINPSVLFNVNQFDKAVFETLPKFVQEKIQQSFEYKKLMNPEMISKESDLVHINADSDDDLPF
jgi:hypothetical protein